MAGGLFSDLWGEPFSLVPTIMGPALPLDSEDLRSGLQPNEPSVFIHLFLQEILVKSRLHGGFCLSGEDGHKAHNYTRKHIIMNTIRTIRAGSYLG